MTDKFVSHYKIIEKIGSGGMGVVYKAEDLNLKRIVAIKFLPTDFNTDPNLQERFIHEAQIISDLDHINIATVYDIGKSEDGQFFLVMAFYNGESLNSQLKRGKISWNEVKNVTVQIAIGLNKAHNQGIIHRDIKPANILITSEGIVKIIDFGLAKYYGETGITRTGTTLGTLAYMSPEQVKNERVDVRTDVWSLGVLFYEMLTGKLPFEGDNDAALIYAILTKAPNDIQDIDPNLIPILKKMLEKNREKRYQSVLHFLDGLVDVGFIEVSKLPTNEKIASKNKIKKFRIKKHVGMFIAAIVIFLGLLVSDFRLITSESIESIKTTPVANMVGQEIYPAFSPDEKRIAYSWSQDSKKRHFRIYIKFIDIGSPLRLTDSAGDDFSPVWSPDGNMLAFARQSYEDELCGIFIISALGGHEKKLTWMSRGYWMEQNLCWSPDGKYILFCRERDKPGSTFALFKIVLESGETKKITDPPQGILGDFWSAISPDGQKFAFLRQKSIGKKDIYTCSVNGENLKQITYNSSDISGITWTKDSDEIVFFSSNEEGEQRLLRIDATGGKPKPMVAGGAHPDISATGNKVAFFRGYMRQNLWKLDLTDKGQLKSKPEKITQMNSRDFGPDISPDGKKIAFSSNQSGNREIWVCEIDGSGPLILTNFKESDCGSPNWSPNGLSVAFDSSPFGHSDIFVVDQNGINQERITTFESDEVLPVWSNDGKWIYFASNKTGQYEIWKYRLESRECFQVTKNGGFDKKESTDGRYLYYTKSGHSELWRMDLSSGYEERFINRYLVMSNWVLAKDGIFVITNDVNKEGLLEFFDYQTRKMTIINSLGSGWTQFMTVSSDQKTIVYSQIDQWETDIFITENFD